MRNIQRSLVVFAYLDIHIGKALNGTVVVSLAYHVTPYGDPRIVELLRRSMVVKNFIDRKLNFKLN